MIECILAGIVVILVFTMIYIVDIKYLLIRTNEELEAIRKALEKE